MKKIKKPKITKFSKNNISKLNYGFLHSRFAYPDGVSIVMKQIEEVMKSELEVPNENIYYLVGSSKKYDKNITQNKLFLDDTRSNKLAEKNYSIGYGGAISERLESDINKAKVVIEEFIKKNKIDVIIAHNTAHPVNFILSVALSRYYRDQIKKNKKTPKYILWWHDSHLERDHFNNPAMDVKRYLLEGVPGPNVEYIIFINNTQFKIARNYFLELAKTKKGFYNRIVKNKDVVYNTTDTFIESFKDLRKTKVVGVKTFYKDFKIEEFLAENNLRLKDTLFCLQHTRILDRKRIDFALKYSFEVQAKINNKRKNKKAMYFLISGHNVKDGTKAKLKKLHKKLLKEYKINNFFLVFAEDNKETTLLFEDYPRIIAALGGFGTYFSEIEGFGNNLLEMLANGLIPVVYTYPVFKKDIEKFNFKLIALNKFEVDELAVNEMVDILKNNRKRKIWVNMNIEILRENFANKLIASKLTRSIIRKRGHI